MAPLFVFSEALAGVYDALLGGFSAAVVFRILQRVVGTLESLVQGDSSDGDAAKKRLASSEASQLRTQDQMRVSASLVKLREQLASGAPPARSMALVGALLDEMLPVDTVGSGASPPRPSRARPRRRSTERQAGLQPALDGCLEHSRSRDA